MTVTVAIPVLDGGPLLAEVLAAVRAQQVDREVELLVIDSGSSDGSRERARDHGARVERIARADFSHGGTRNRLMELSRGEHVAFLTQDSVPAGPHWLAALLRGFERAGDVALVTGPYLPRPGASPMVRRELTEYFARFGGPRVDRGSGDAGPATFFTSANGAVARWAWRRTPFRPLPYAEDQQLARDVLAAGLAKAYEPDAAVTHSHDLPPGSALRRYFDDFRALAEVHGHEEPLSPRFLAARIRNDVAADRAYMRREGLDVQTWRSFRHQSARALGRSLGANADRLPAWARRVLSHDGRASFERLPARPVLFVTNHAPPFRVGAFAALHEREDVVFALIGGGVRHGGGAGGDGELPFPVLRPREREILGLAASGRYRAVVAGLSGRVALPAAYAGARRAQVPFVLWATIWAHPRTPAHALSYLPLARMYRHADAIVTYGPHVSAYVRAKGARGPVFVAPQSVDHAFWSGPAEPDRRAPFQVMFAGRAAGEKGLAVLLRAWTLSGLSAPSAALVLVGGGPIRARAAATGAVLHAGPSDPAEMRNFYAGSDVVVVPSIPTRDFLEPWGLVVNEAFEQGVPVIATDAVGAVAGGLVQHERTGLVVPAGDAGALAAAIRRLHADPGLRARLGAGGRAAVAAHTHEAWAAGMARGLAAAGAGRPKDGC